jgi:Na+/proline symporter
MRLSDLTVIYLLGLLFSAGYVFVSAMTVTKKDDRRRTARAALLLPVWPVAWVWGLIVAVPALWRMADWGKK